MKKNILLLFLLITSLAFAQIPVNGNVTDKTGEPIPGVNIIEKGSSNGVITDFNGNYEITVASNTAVLEFSFIGFEKQEITIGDQNRIDVELNESAEPNIV